MPTATVAYNGFVKDLVSPHLDGPSGLVVDEVEDGTYTVDVSYAGTHVISSIDVSNGFDWWNTVPDDGKWIAAVTSATSDDYLNSAADGSVAIEFTDSKRLHLYLADNGSQAAGTTYRVTVCFAGEAQCAETDVTTTAIDADSDGFPVVVDCDDDDDTIHPGATETIGDNVDQDCDGYDGSTFYADADADGYGDPASTESAGAQPEGFVGNDDDCNDADSTINPGATELAGDAVDQDCSGGVGSTFYLDGDGDTFGNPEDSLVADAAPEHHVDNGADCNDADAAINPGADEIPGNGEDDDCDSTTSDVVEPAETTLGPISYSNGSYTNKGTKTSITTTVSSVDGACVAGREVNFTLTNTATGAMTEASGVTSTTATSPAKVSVQVTLTPGVYSTSLSSDATASPACSAGLQETAGTVTISSAKPKGRK